MWFYIDENGNKKGPLTTDGLVLLFKHGTLGGQTKVWKNGMAMPLSISECRDLRILNFSEKSRRELLIEKYSTSFRALVYVLLCLIAAFVFYTLKIADYVEGLNIAKNIKVDDIFIDFQCATKMKKYIGYAIFFFTISAAFTFSRYLATVAKVAKTKRTLLTTQFSAAFLGYSFFIPFFNILLPCYSVVYCMKIGCERRRRQFSAEMLILILLWWFFVLFSLSIGAYLMFLFPKTTSYNLSMCMLYLDCLASAAGAVAAILSYAVSLLMNRLYIVSVDRSR